MSIDKKLIFAAENQERVYEAGKGAERDRFWDEFQQNGQRRNYNLAFGGEYWDDERIKKMKYPLNVGQLYAYMMFARSNVVDLADALGDEMLVLSGPQYAFTLCNKLERVGRLECCNYCGSIFTNAPELTTVIELRLISARGTSPFENVPKLTYVKFSGEDSINIPIDLSSCTAETTITVPEDVLDDAGNVEIAAGTQITETGVMYNPTIKTLIPALKSGANQTLTLGEINKAKLTEADIATITGKGWTIV